MAINKEKLARVADTERQDVDLLRENADPVKDFKGIGANHLAGALRLIAVSDYVIGNSSELFRKGTSEAALLRAKLFERFDMGGMVSPSFVSMMSYKGLLNALAAGDYQVAKYFSSLMGGRYEIEHEYDRSFDIAFGYALKYVVLSSFEEADQWVEKLEAECKAVENQDFSGYAKVLRAILDGSEKAVDVALKEILAGHKRQCSGKGFFKDTEDELLCVWGIAIANLARMHGMKIKAVEPLIPADLLS